MRSEKKKKGDVMLETEYAIIRASIDRAADRARLVHVEGADLFGLGRIQIDTSNDSLYEKIARAYRVEPKDAFTQDDFARRNCRLRVRVELVIEDDETK